MSREGRAQRRPASAAALLAAVAVMTSACTTDAPAVPTETTERQIGIGLEDIVAEAQDWAAIDGRLDEADVNSVSIAVGRIEWTAFRQAEHPEAAPSIVRESGRDFVAEAIAAVGTAANGERRRITLSIDALVPATIEDDSDLAARSADGEASQSFASAAALEGEVGDRIAALAEEVAQRYAPDEVNLTELMFDGWSFGDADLASYRAATGADDWPRAATGDIAADDARIADWRSDVIAALVERVAERVRPLGVEVSIDVRVDPREPASGRPESGHDYARLAAAADRLVLWNYFGMHDLGAGVSSGITAALPDAGVDPARVLVQVGMWTGREGAAISPDALEDGLRLTATNGVARVGVTPLSMIDGASWAAIERAWR